jgi:uncharacterized protein YodC (DUF2158 family)
MLKLPKPAAIAMQATLGIALSAPWAISALAAPTATQSPTTPRLQEGDLVRLRSGGPEMTVKSARGNWVIAIWWNEAFGGFQSAGFPVAMVDGPITLPPVEVSPQTRAPQPSSPQTGSPQTGSPQTGPTEPSERPPGDLSSAGQPNQNIPPRRVSERPVNVGTSTSPSTRPARILRILLSQQATEPLQRGTGTQTNGVPQVRPALALPQGTALNQTLPLNQSTGTNQTIGVPQVRPALVLPQGTVQMTLPLNQRTGR